MIFEQALGVEARLRGDERGLAPAASRCVNCHAREEVPPPSGASPVVDRAPVLNAASLLELRRRRHAPPSRFDEASFCRLLATGIDAAEVMVRRGMPIYALSREDCAALWLFLTSPGRAP